MERMLQYKCPSCSLPLCEGEPMSTQVEKDQCKYKVVHIPTNATSYYSNKLAAVNRARGIDGMMFVRSAANDPYQLIREYRYGKVRR